MLCMKPNVGLHRPAAPFVAGPVEGLVSQLGGFGSNAALLSEIDRARVCPSCFIWIVESAKSIELPYFLTMNW